MFIQCETSKNEKIIVPVRKILLIVEEKKGVTVFLEDGTSFLVLETIETIGRRLYNHCDLAEERSVITFK